MVEGMIVARCQEMTIATNGELILVHSLKVAMSMIEMFVIRLILPFETDGMTQEKEIILMDGTEEVPLCGVAMVIRMKKISKEVEKDLAVCGMLQLVSEDKDAGIMMVLDYFDIHIK